jgi:hypothetical protein
MYANGVVHAELAIRVQKKKNCTNLSYNTNKDSTKCRMKKGIGLFKYIGKTKSGGFSSTLGT